ncbi:phenylacetate--CoA ligase family protein [Candidatus Fermentibacteria bacterium]|nr:phenylacetate--CoA ligase family protein [Candidatus Fermentibacteria bacterium]
MLEWYVTQGAKHTLALVPSALREPMGLWRRSRAVLQAETWTRERIRAERVQRLNRVLSRAVRHVAFYREHAPGGLPLRTVEDLQHWPVVDRSTISERIDEFRSDCLPKWRTRGGATTGRSGVPLGVRWDWPGALWWEHAFHRRLFRWAGLPKGFRRVILRGGLVHGPRGPESRWWQVVPQHRALVLSVFQLSHATIEPYVRAMARFQPHALLAYPSAAAKFARLVRERGLSLPPLRAIVTSSESLLPEDRAIIEETLGATATDFYGHAERAVAAAQCEHGSYHVFEDYGYAEILDAAGEPVLPGAVGEIVATGFHNRAMPFIRYRTGDHAAFSPDGCACGRAFRVLSILEGRPPEYLIAHDGTRVALRFGLGSAELGGIEELRFFPRAPGVAEIRYVCRAGAAAPSNLLDSLRIRTGDAIDYRLVRVDRLHAGPGGKAVLVDRSEYRP